MQGVISSTKYRSIIRIIIAWHSLCTYDDGTTQESGSKSQNKALRIKIRKNILDPQLVGGNHEQEDS